MKTCHGLLLIWLALLSRVSAERPQTVVATIPSEVLLQHVAKDGRDEPLAVDGGLSLSTKNFEVTAFITKNGDIFELPSPRSMGSIEAREEPELETGMKMCRYGNIVVYSDSDCNSFFSPSELPGRPLKSQIQNDNEPEEDDDVRKPAKKRNKVKRNKRKPNKNRNKNKNKKRLNKNRRKQQQRRKALKKQQNQRRRRNKLKNGGKRGNPQRKNKRRVNKNRNGNKVNKRRRINDDEAEGRSDVEVAPLQFAILLNRH